MATSTATGQQTQDQPPVNIVGEKVALGPLTQALVPCYYRWDNDFAVLRTLFIPRPSTLEEYEAFYESLKERNDEWMIFTIYERATMRPIGRADLSSISYRDRSAEFSIIIGEADARGRGYGTETTRLMLDFAFNGLCLHSVGLQTWEYNLAGQRAYMKAGFRECGRRRQAKMMGNRLWDIVYMDCLATEFESPVLSRVFVPDVPRTLP